MRQSEAGNFVLENPKLTKASTLVASQEQVG
jgi:hypothetical protein